MTERIVRLTGIVLLCAGTVQAMGTPQQLCDKARVQAWTSYASCINGVVAKDAQGLVFDEFAAFARCRHKYFASWTAFQTKAALVTSTCVGSRLTDDGDTVTDNLTGLVWEKKVAADSAEIDLSQPQRVNNPYSWSSGASYCGNGAAFTDFLIAMNNGSGFAGANDWRLPTLAELQTLELDFPCSGRGGSPTCSCGVQPCIDGLFGPTSFIYWSATTYTPVPETAWVVLFWPISTGGNGSVADKLSNLYVRAVRGGF